MKLLLILVMASTTAGCQVLLGTKKISADGLIIPFIKNSPNECYFLDEFMPTPNSLVTGKAGAMNLRYYTYNSANYKDWKDKQVMLSFYSNDDLCWSLFEEHYVVDD